MFKTALTTALVLTTASVAFASEHDPTPPTAIRRLPAGRVVQTARSRCSRAATSR